VGQNWRRVGQLKFRSETEQGVKRTKQRMSGSKPEISGTNQGVSWSRRDQ
jgi:hypothetical protein